MDGCLIRRIRPKSDAEQLELDKRRFGIEIAERSPLPNIYVEYPLDEQGPYHVPDGQNVHCLCIATDQWHTCWWVLRRVQYVPVEVYERIGMAWQNPGKVKEQGSWAASSDVGEERHCYCVDSLDARDSV